MALFTISDVHLSLSTDKSMDVFSGWTDYVSRIENNWKAVVSDDDSVVLPGDISWEMKIQNATEDFGFINSLPGRKYIIKGNHDLWWTSMTKMNAFLKDNGFDTITILNNAAVRIGDVAVCGTRGWMIEESGTDSKLINREAIRLRMSLEEGRKLGGEPIVFLHYPPVTFQNECTELVSVLHKYDVKRVYYGHLHGDSAFRAFEGNRDGIEYRVVSCDRVGFTPVLVSRH